MYLSIYIYIEREKDMYRELLLLITSTAGG